MADMTLLHSYISRALSLVLPFALGASVSLNSGCKDDPGGKVDPYAAPTFSLQDTNPYSTSYTDTLSPADMSGGVLVLYFGSYG